jgi:hypothetical protein
MVTSILPQKKEKLINFNFNIHDEVTNCWTKLYNVPSKVKPVIVKSVTVTFKSNKRV